jgi:hypothetical protein
MHDIDIARHSAWSMFEQSGLLHSQQSGALTKMQDSSQFMVLPEFDLMRIYWQSNAPLFH